MKLQQSKCKEGLLFSGSTQPLVQVSLIDLVCFRCPGMFNALAGMEGGGQVKLQQIMPPLPSKLASPFFESLVGASIIYSVHVSPLLMAAPLLSFMQALSLLQSLP
jgi:hypothetical protein